MTNELIIRINKLLKGLKMFNKKLKDAIDQLEHKVSKLVYHTTKLEANNDLLISEVKALQKQVRCTHNETEFNIITGARAYNEECINCGLTIGYSLLYSEVVNRKFEIAKAEKDKLDGETK